MNAYQLSVSKQAADESYGRYILYLHVHILTHLFRHVSNVAPIF